MVLFLKLLKQIMISKKNCKALIHNLHGKTRLARDNTDAVIRGHIKHLPLKKNGKPRKNHILG
jgi:hypothetical protein